MKKRGRDQNEAEMLCGQVQLSRWTHVLSVAIYHRGADRRIAVFSQLMISAKRSIYIIFSLF